MYRVEALGKYRPVVESEARRMWIEDYDLTHKRLYNEHVRML